jgi:hypothetical protein
MLPKFFTILRKLVNLTNLKEWEKPDVNDTIDRALAEFE